MNNISFKQIYEEIKKAKNILILTHLNPDGDAIGSMLALKLIIERLNISVTGLITNKLEFMNFIPESETLLLETDKEYDLTLIVDANSLSRLGHLESLGEQSKKTIIIDHHNITNKIESLHYVDATAASTTMVIYEMIKENNLPIDYNLALYLYIGLLTDTGGFAYNNTTSKTFAMASDLLSYGLKQYDLYLNFINQEYDLNYLKLKKIAIENLEIIDGKIAVTSLNYDTIQKYPYDNAKFFVELGRSIKGIEASLIFIEEEPDSYKVSLRSKKYLDMAAISQKFGGGGHKSASGIRFKSNYETTKNNIINEIKQNLK